MIFLVILEYLKNFYFIIRLDTLQMGFQKRELKFLKILFSNLHFTPINLLVTYH